MTIKLFENFLAPYGKYFTVNHIKKNSALPFKDHHKFPCMIDTLSRKNIHHIFLQTAFSPQWFPIFLESFFLSLTNENTPPFLHTAELIYLEKFMPEKDEAIERHFDALFSQLENDKKYLLIAISAENFLSIYSSHQQDRNYLTQFFSHSHCRFILLSNDTIFLPPLLNIEFSFLKIAEPSKNDRLLFLKHQRTELENFHNVIIPDELLTHAHALTERYLSAEETVTKTLLLLDSGAARAAMAERVDNASLFKPTLSVSILNAVLSHWTHIPVTHLTLHQFKMHDFTHGMQQRLFGQEIAISLISQRLQHAHASLLQPKGTFSSFLFVGEKHTGKKTAALIIGDQLFKQNQAVYIASLSQLHHASIIDVPFECHGSSHFLSLHEVLEHVPYAIFVIENIHLASPEMLNELHEIVRTGYLHHAQMNYNFTQSIVILTTTLGDQRIKNLSKSFAPDDEAHHMDLMQLVMNDKKPTTHSFNHHDIPHELIEEITLEISSQLGPLLCQEMHIVPFIPLAKGAIENILRRKMTSLGKRLHERNGIELGYAPEVIRYLANEVAMKQNQTHIVDVERVLSQLYFVIEQAILMRGESKNRPNQLFLQLNENGQLLRCDWLALSTVRHHAT